MLWHWISIDPNISSFGDIGGFQVCLNFVPIDTIFIIHVIDDITQSMTLFDGMAGSMDRTLNSRETRRPGECFLSGQRNGFPGQKNVGLMADSELYWVPRVAWLLLRIIIGRRRSLVRVWAKLALGFAVAIG